MKYILKEIFSTIVIFLVMFLVILGVYKYIAEPFIVDGASMEYTLRSGERLWMLKLNNIDRFDVVIFPAPSDEEKLYVKRVIGVPGDTIAYENGELILNGEAMNEPYLAQKESEFDGNFTYDFTLEEITGEITVPEGKLFVMGDNRRNSLDGRRFGFIDADDVLGEADFIHWPLNEFGLLDKYELSEDGTEIVAR
ncbi:signal peptidase I [Fundicoccus ignavus]|uniref:Signal peptidase I n=1 Tax=Fundicoccus ignavus TaxID=2664442 RepID=A0A844CBG5_9LACT|nr:signal peptidase I [Fundicoccus ignavus]MRJ46831.1 signal peptidase I [Fundicoccus ignavus]